MSQLTQFYGTGTFPKILAQTRLGCRPSFGPLRSSDRARRYKNAQRCGLSLVVPVVKTINIRTCKIK